MNKPIYVVGGSKGGVGKSMVSMGLTHFLIDSGEKVFLIDADFYTEQQTEPDHVFSCLDALNRQARLFFRWCITERLHRAMGPVPLA